REELVPCGEARALAVGDDLELLLAPGRVGVVEVTLHELHERLVTGEGDRGVGTGCPFDLPRGLGEEAPVLTPGARGGRADQRQPLLELAREVLPRRVAFGEVGEPGAVRIGERLDGEDPPPDAVERERACPAVVVDVAHRSVSPRALGGTPVLQRGDEHLVAFLEDVGRHLEDGAHLALHGIPATIHRGGDGFDHDGAARMDDRAHAARPHAGSAKPSAAASGSSTARASGWAPQSSKNWFCVAQWPYGSASERAPRIRAIAAATRSAVGAAATPSSARWTARRIAKRTGPRSSSTPSVFASAAIPKTRSGMASRTSRRSSSSRACRSSTCRATSRSASGIGTSTWRRSWTSFRFSSQMRRYVSSCRSSTAWMRLVSTRRRSSRNRWASVKGSPGKCSSMPRTTSATLPCAQRRR